MTKLRKTLAVSGIIVATSVAGLGAAGPASASIDQCQKGYFCMWSGPNFTGEFFQVAHNVDFLGESPLDMNDKISSVKNRSYYDATLFFDSYQHGVNVTFEPGDSFANLGQIPDFDNTASSVRLWREVTVS